MGIITLKNYKEILGEDIEEYNWSCISAYQTLSDDFIREFKNEVDWSCISVCQKLSENFIREFKNKVDWSCISVYQTLSNDFIREFKDKVDWYWISACQKLSDEFIREFKNEVDWSCISAYQTLSDEFIREFKDKLILEKLNIKSVFHSGKSKRCIYIKKSNPEIIHIGCFSGTKEEAIKAVSEKYSGNSRDEYIEKIEECFGF
jgi:phosphoribosylanthranilate isomerase